MQFNVVRLLRGPVGQALRYSVDETDLVLGDAEAQRIWGRVRLTRVNKGVWVAGAMNATTTCSCSRCLRECATTLHFRFDQTYYPVIDVNTGVALDLPEDADHDFVIDRHHIVDITEAVRQSVIVSVPMKPLCTDDCAGICPRCGADLNREACACEGGVRDERWRPLLEMLPHMER